MANCSEQIQRLDRYARSLEQRIEELEKERRIEVIEKDGVVTPKLHHQVELECVDCEARIRADEREKQACHDATIDGIKGYVVGQVNKKQWLNAIHGVNDLERHCIERFSAALKGHIPADKAFIQNCKGFLPYCDGCRLFYTCNSTNRKASTMLKVTP